MPQQIQSGIPATIGWLLNSEKKLALFFTKDPRSMIRRQNVITQLWYSSKEGIPIKLKNTREMSLENALETWNELLSNGWESIENQLDNKIA